MINIRPVHSEYINVRLRGDEQDARLEAMRRNRGKPVHIKSVFFVRDAHGDETGERDFVFSPTMGGRS